MMTDFNDLRNSVDFDDDDSPSGDIPVDLDALLAGNEPEKRSDGRFLGMTAGQRAFLSMVLFLNVLILGAGLLIVTGRVAF
jgi:hypothetical protein